MTRKLPASLVRKATTDERLDALAEQVYRMRTMLEALCDVTVALGIASQQEEAENPSLPRMPDVLSASLARLDRAVRGRVV